ncbi:phosphate/phosphite/phosphonate ABC transporter substrate-binding protein [Pseudomonas vancouverensis]|uniref:Phosphate/phosphite/phosphonate ABC transporter substrate-binding protein n=1 Tax=Pseudomonas vancouverensis TaxID=95300 RepID=A0A643D1D3_PSEVA|nr:phosphate/phosphite/phosphonate ABC transporter substrate-binding protein [Pseudomonas vancouverensis]KAB0491245.1 phosphate/phosphite/phosphonate ABC transporter substrate-binding protein [Pseudomonas vancouverensis]
MRAVKWFTALVMACFLTTPAYAKCTQQGLRIAVIPKKNMDVLREHKPLADRLSAELHMPVDIVPSSSYESVVDAIVSGGVDIAWLGPASYMLAYQRDPRIEPFASLTISGGYFTPAGHHYQALLLARGDQASDWTALRGKRVVLTDPASTSGSVVPNTEFSTLAGQPLLQFFSSIVYSGSHDKSMDALLEGKVDAAFVSSVRADAYLNSGKIGRDTFKVLWRSDPIYYDPFVFSGSLCAPLKKRIRAAMLSNQEQLASFLDSQEASGIVSVTHAEYAPLLHMMQTQP